MADPARDSSPPVVAGETHNRHPQFTYHKKERVEPGNRRSGIRLAPYDTKIGSYTHIAPPGLAQNPENVAALEEFSRQLATGNRKSVWRSISKLNRDWINAQKRLGDPGRQSIADFKNYVNQTLFDNMTVSDSLSRNRGVRNWNNLVKSGYVDNIAPSYGSQYKQTGKKLSDMTPEEAAAFIKAYNIGRNRSARNLEPVMHLAYPPEPSVSVSAAGVVDTAVDNPPPETPHVDRATR